MRKLYSSSEAQNKKTFNSSFLGIEGTKSTAASRTGKLSLQSPGGGYEEKIHSKHEVKDILIKKIKEFRDLLQMYQKKRPNSSVLPLSEFKNVLKGVGINIGHEVS